MQLATKFGCTRGDGKVVIVGTPEYVRKACDASLERLGVDYIDLLYQHRTDSTVSIEVTVGQETSQCCFSQHVVSTEDLFD